MIQSRDKPEILSSNSVLDRKPHSRVLQFDIKCEELAPVKDKWVKYNEERIKKLTAAPQTPPEDADLSSKIFFWLPSSYVHFVTGNLLNPFF